jgi:murein DD-endopeptidase MepM/ murein hydrolase activator NlpD
MTHGIDASFRLKREARAARRRSALLRRVAAGCAVLLAVAIGAGIYLTRDQWSFGDEDEDLQPTEEMEDLPAGAPVYVPAIVDLAGDPMWITLASEGGAASKTRTVAKPDGLTQPGVSPQIEVLADTMLSSSERFMTTIPSTQEDFAFFQAQRATPASAIPIAPTANDEDMDLAPVETEPSAAGQPAAPAGAGDAAAIDDPDAGWGETIDQGQASLPTFQKTAIANNTSVGTVSAETDRFESTEDTFVKILDDRTLDSVVGDAHFSADDAKAAGAALKALFALDGLTPGDVVAMRGFRPRRGAPALAVMQVSIYAHDRFVGTLARNDRGAFVSGVDPWVRDDLFNYSGASGQGTLKRQYRLLDAIYSTAARNNVPTSVIGEAIMYLSRGQDLNAFASFDQRLVLIYSDTPRDKDGTAGRVLYVGVQGGEKPLECFVFQQSDGEYACVTGADEVHSLSAANGMVTPVAGVMTSTFGPRKHPILGTVRIHKGVDWAAPVGTPVAAAYDGEIVYQGDGAGYGNVVRIQHEGGRETRYAHLSKFATAGAGTRVKAGDVIGYVGTTGLSTGPHLHFELYQAGAAVDPLGTVTVVAAEVGDSAVETLTDRIVHVESGGSARAKNPLSSATGLGQFISKTWIRMMNTYRPDLARSLSTQQLLDLRYDPTISREMVRNLAREGEAYLRARGHQITAGRLYLCHFLGMEGAHQVLAAPGDALLVNVLGSSVIQANPFLTGKNASYVIAWAERKMGGKAPPPSASPTAPTTIEVKQTSPEFEQYKQAIAGIVGSLQTAL